MKNRPVPSRIANQLANQRGVVLFIALIVMVAMSLAAIALIRSVDTTNVLIGNLAFRQASILPANLAVEQAAAALFADASPAGAPTIADPTVDLLAQNYYASWQNNDDPRGIPKPLQTRNNWNCCGALAKELSDASTGINIRYVIERMCLASGAAKPSNCDMLPPKQSTGTTIHDCDNSDTAGTQGCFGLNPIPFYRVTVRVDGPQNSTSYLQAMLRE